jgi:glutathione S-transferase
MLTLYHAPHSRSSRIIWLLEELDVDYTIKPVSIRRRDINAQSLDAPMVGARDPENPHPHGKVPAIMHDGELVFESNAIVLYLTDAFPNNGLGPKIGEPLRGTYLSWLAYYGDVMEPALTTTAFGFTTTNSTTGWSSAAEVMGFVNATLEKGPYILGEKFSGADILFGSTFAMFMGSPMVPRTDTLTAYVERISARPAYARWQAKENS